MKFKNFVLGVGILVVYALVLWQGIQAFYPTPEYQDFCDYDISPRPLGLLESEKCENTPILDNKINSCYKEGGEFRYEYDDRGCITGGYCDECRIHYDESMNEYSRNVFIISLIAGVIVFILGLFILSIEPVGSALLASGVWSLFYGTVINWRNFSNYIKFGMLLIVLIVLIWVAVRLNKKGRFFRKKL